MQCISQFNLTYTHLLFRFLLFLAFIFYSPIHQMKTKEKKNIKIRRKNYAKIIRNILFGTKVNRSLLTNTFNISRKQQLNHFVFFYFVFFPRFDRNMYTFLFVCVWFCNIMYVKVKYQMKLIYMSHTMSTICKEHAKQ